MTETGLKKLEQRPILQMMTRTIAIIGLTAALPGCINVSAPDKPIEINLNINVTQEVVYRLDGEAKSLIQQNPGIF
ncbi:YnbE-like lipoprotein [Sphingomonas sp. OK281]|nr:YnbE-like lipoprotein [Sphingomonas sp. OK281]